MKLYVKIGSQQQFNGKGYFIIKNALTGNYLYLKDDVGMQKKGIYSDNLKELLINSNGQMDILNLALNENGNFYERNMASTVYAEMARKDIGSICYNCGSRIMNLHPMLKCKYVVMPITKKKDYGFLAAGKLEIDGRYTLILKKDYMGYYYLYDNKFLCVEAIKDKKTIVREMKMAINDAFDINI